MHYLSSTTANSRVRTHTVAIPSPLHREKTLSQYMVHTKTHPYRKTPYFAKNNMKLAIIEIKNLLCVADVCEKCSLFKSWRDNEKRPQNPQRNCSGK